MPSDDYQYRELPLPNKRTPNPESMLGTVIGANNGNSPDSFGIGGGSGGAFGSGGSNVGSGGSAIPQGLQLLPGGAGGGGGGSTTCASTSDIGTLNVGEINMPCSSPVSTINDYSILLVDASNSTFAVDVSAIDGLLTLSSTHGSISIDIAPIFAAFPAGNGVVEFREFNVCDSGVAKKQLILASQTYT